MPEQINYVYQDKLESERLITRYLVANDVHAWTKFMSNSETVEFIPNPDQKAGNERSKYWIEKQLNRYANKLFGLQALVNKQTGEMIGQCGLLLQEIDGKSEVEVGYHVFREHWGKGYAPEAAKMFLNYGFRNNITGSIISIIHIDNHKSQKVAQKNGLIREKQSEWLGLPVVIYRIKKETFENR